MRFCHFCFLCFTIFIIIIMNVEIQSVSADKNLQSFVGTNNQTTELSAIPHKSHSRHRRLLEHGCCTNKDISISQSRDSSAGIPQYIVEIVNTCISGCAPSEIHLHCGWFASARMVNPTTFKRLSFDDCIVNGGKPLRSSQIIRFTYSNSFMYSLVFKSAKFCHY